MTTSELYLVGTSYKYSNIEFREYLIENFESFAEDFKGCNEKFSLITCNRIEFYFITENPLEILKKYEPDKRYYVKKGKEAVEHLLRVSLGLDSFLPGEESIYYQIKDSFIKALKKGEIRSSLRCIINRTLNSSKKIRKAGLVTANNEIAVEIAKKSIEHLGQKNIKAVIIGSGRTAKTIYSYLKNDKNRISIVTSRKLYDLEFQGADVYSYNQLKEAINGADIIYSATTIKPKSYIIDEDIIKGLTIKPKLIVDLGVPRNINPKVKDLGVSYWDMEETYRITKKEENASEYLNSLIAQEASNIYLAAYYKKIRPEIKALMKKAQRIISQETAIAEKYLSVNQTEKNYIINKMAERIVKKILEPLLNNPKNEKELMKKIKALEALGVKYGKNKDSYEA
ncbi:MAG: hypothetical protein ACP5LF_04340 [Nitrososphaeria archaeon]